MMLPKSARLQKSGDFERLYRTGRRLNSPHFRILYLRQQNQNPSRFGFVVSKKQAGTIAFRNRQKRILRAYISDMKEKIRPGFDVIIQPRSTSPDLSVNEKKEEIVGLLERAGLIKI